MSLLNSATIWNNEENQNITKKRTPTMRKTVKFRPMQEGFANSSEFEGEGARPLTIPEIEEQAKLKNSRVHELLNKITTENDGDKLANFKPLPNPIVQKRNTPGNEKETNQLNLHYKADDLLPVHDNPLQVPPPPTMRPPSSAIYSASTGDLGNYFGNYQTSYGGNTRFQGRNSTINSVHPQTQPLMDNKILEKINYMIHLLEEQQVEKTSNIMEEFVMYTFLGIFIIFTVDSFTRVGKYVR